MPAWGVVIKTGAVLIGKGPAKPVIDAATKAAGEANRERRERRANRLHAERLARQVGGQLAEVSLRGSEKRHLIVVKHGEPFAAYPHVDGDLADRPELQSLSEEMLYDPRPAKRPRHARRAVKQRKPDPLVENPPRGSDETA